jgi:hypothetical protein
LGCKATTVKCGTSHHNSRAAYPTEARKSRFDGNVSQCSSFLGVNDSHEDMSPIPA